MLFCFANVTFTLMKTINLFLKEIKMKNLNGNDFVMIDNGVTVCVKNSKYEDFNVKEGMMVVDKSMAITAFELWDGTDLDAESDVIVSYLDETGDNFVGWVKKHGKWEKIYFSVLYEYADLCLYLKSVIKVRNWDITKPNVELYTGDGFTIEDIPAGEKCNNGGEYGFYTNYRKTDIDGLYKVTTWCTCDFDDCGTGFQGYEWISKEEFENFYDSDNFYDWLKRPCRNDVAVNVFKELLSKQN